MKTKSHLSPKNSPATLVCRNCNQELPSEFFYFNKRTQCPDKYCKECRKSISRKQYNSGKFAKAQLPEKHAYPVITEIEDRETRIELTLHALAEVRLSIERKKKKQQEEEALLS